MFNLSQSNTYTWGITVEFPVNGGRFEKQSFDAEFKRLSQTAIESWLERISKDEAKDSDFAKEIMVGWKGISADGVDVPFSEEARDRLFDIPLVVGAIVRAYMTSFSGAKAKN